MIVTVFRSRLRPGIRDEYVALADRMNGLAMTMPGYVSHKGFFADDGERVTIVEFEHDEGMRAWRTNPEHRAAQKLARESSTASTISRSARSIVSRASRPSRSWRRPRVDRRVAPRHLAAHRHCTVFSQVEGWKSSPYSKASPRRSG